MRASALGAPATYQLRSPAESVAIEGFRVIITAPRHGVPTSQREVTFDFTSCRHRDAILGFLVRDTSRAGNSVLADAEVLSGLGRYLSVVPDGWLNAERYATYLEYIQRGPGRRIGRVERIGPSNSRQRRQAEVAANMYEYGLDAGLPGYVRQEHEGMTSRRKKRFRGHNRRVHHERREAGLSESEYTRLLVALRLELDSCEDRLRLHAAGDEPLAIAGLRGGRNPDGSAAKRHIDPNPYVCFAMLAGIELGMRSPEFNNLRLDDVTAFPDKIRVRAPNKPHADLTLTPQVRRALDIVIAYAAQVRSDTPLGSMLCICRNVVGNHKRVNDTHVTSSLLSSRWLPRFYGKYFRMVRPGEQTPVLYADLDASGELKPLNVPLADFRSIGLTAFARSERNLDIVRTHARHASLQTTETYYLRQRERQRLTDTSRYLTPSVERIRMLMARDIVADPDACTINELRRADALVPLGHCDEALKQHLTPEEEEARALGYRAGCIRARDCRLCDNFRPHAGLRDVYVKEAESAISEAINLRGRGELREAENQMEFAALNQAIVDAVDEYLRADASV
jgi:integrase